VKTPEVKSKGGIYVIIHAPTARRYVGSTNNLSNRFGRHRTQLRAGIHHNRALQKDWTDSKESDFKLEIIQKFQTKYDESRRFVIERTFINSCDPTCSYNILSADEGRHDADGVQLKQHLIKLHADHWKAFEALGGVEWLRDVIDSASPPKP
jgi:group I intron endonuclease